MKFASAIKTLVLGFALLGPAAGCGNDNPSVTVTATAREIRGTVPARRNVTRVIAVDVKTKRVVASVVPDAQRRFVLTGLTKGARYKITLVIGRTSKPLVFPRPAGLTGKTNIFGIGTRRCVGRPMCTEGPIDLGEIQDPGPDDTGAIETTPAASPLMQEDFDEDGMPDAMDMDVDGDNMPNAMDTDNDGDSMPDNAQFGDQDGDGLTNEVDPDVDGDNMPNEMDMDNDGDGTPDAMETDTDGDGTPDETDTDIDGDGLPNADDDSPVGEGEPAEP
jgi:hypothetical protein